MSKILAIGAHFDDVELRCLGTILKAKDAGYSVSLIVATNGAKGGLVTQRYKEQDEVNKLVGYDSVIYFQLPDGRLEHNSELVSLIEHEISTQKPDLILTHSPHDFHQDHIAVSNSVLSANRLYDSAVIMFPGQDYRIHSNPNIYVDIAKYIAKKKSILKHYKSQSKKRYWKNNQYKIEEFYLQYMSI